MNQGFDPLAIGGSSAGSCLGVGWESGLALWQRLRGEASQVERWTREQRRMLAAGHALEPIVAAAVLEDYGVQLEMHPATVVHPEHPRIVGHLDAWVRPGEIGAEVKVSQRGDGWGDPDTDQIPAPYVVQCVHYLALTGAREWHVFRCTPTWRVDRYIVRRDEQLCRDLIAREVAMLRLVDANTPPDPLDEAEARARWFATVPGKSVPATDEVARALVRRAVAKKAIKLAEQVASDAALVLLRHAQDASAITHDFGSGKADTICTLGANRVFDAAEFERRYPSLHADCLAFSPARAREMDRKAYESCMRAPATADESVRVIRTTKPFNAALARMLAGELAALPFVPEFQQLTTTEE